MVRDLYSDVAVNRYAYMAPGDGANICYVYDIKSCSSTTDTWVLITKENSPKIILSSTSGTTIDKYLDVYICDGDAYSGGTFYKRVYSGENKYVDFPTYYRMLCEDEIKKNVLEYSFSALNDNKSFLGIPLWMLSGQTEYSISGETVEQIDFSKEYYNSSKTDAVEQMIYENALKTAHQYGCDLNMPSAVTEVSATSVVVSGVTVQPSKVDIINGGRVKFSAIITPDYATDKAVKWEVKKGTGDGVIDDNGNFKATSSGKCEVIATSNDATKETVSGGCEVNIQ